MLVAAVVEEEVEDLVVVVAMANQEVQTLEAVVDIAVAEGLELL